LITNTLERAISADQNRAQLFAACDRAEIARYTLDVSLGSDDLTAAAVATGSSTLNNPLTAEIVNGFCVHPQLSTDGFTGLDVLVDQGVMWAIAPDGDPDSSNYKLVRDPGVSALPSSLQMTTNSSGSTRIDVVECSYVLNTPETDNRDIWNPATNTFAAAAVSKATQGGLVYRIRVGTPGAGFPGTASGWLPLAVASVPTGTTSNDTITFWDVRPIVEDRILSPSNVGSDYPRWHHANYMVNTAVAGKAILTGTVDVSGTDIITPSPGTRRLGGRLRTSGISADVISGIDGLDLNDSNNWSAAITTATAFLYLLDSPFGLPRWCRYTNAASGARVPRNPRGFLVVSTQPPTSFYGSPGAGIGLPASTGLGTTTTTKGVCIATLKYTGGACAPTTCDGRTQWNSAAYAASPVTGTTVGTTTPYTVNYVLGESTNFPPGVKAIWADVQLDFTPTAGAIVTLTATISDFSGNPMTTLFQDAVTGYASNATSFWHRFRIPIPATYLYAGLSYLNPTLSIGVSASNATTPIGTPALYVVGWDLY
jgi:hypothetical protein